MTKLFVKSPDTREWHIVLSYICTNDYVDIVDGTVPLVDYKGRRAEFGVQL